jgi:hypothetical protein
VEEKITLVTQKRDLFSLPKDLPVPKDDGACVHLEGMLVPSIKLRSTGNGLIDLSIEAKNPTVVFSIPEQESHLSPLLQTGISYLGLADAPPIVRFSRYIL